MSQRIDLGLGHTLEWVAFRPDRSIPANAERFHGIPDDDRCGARIGHPHLKKPGELCSGYITFDVPSARLVAREKWAVDCWEPLTLSPSVLCTECGDHGFIRGGKWVPA